MRYALALAVCFTIAGCPESSTSIPAGSFAIHAVVESGTPTTHWDPLEAEVAIDPTPALTHAEVEKIEQGTDELTGAPQLVVHFTERGATAFSDFTAAHVGQKIAFVIDGRVASAPVVMERIPGGRAMISTTPSQLPAMRSALGFD